MSREKRARALGFLVLTALLGCGDDVPSDRSDPMTEGVGAPAPSGRDRAADVGGAPAQDTAVAVLPPATVEPLRTLLLADTVDLDGDDAGEVVELWVAADRDDRGRLMMDDGQRWLLAVRDDGRLQPLFAEFVQLAAPRVWVYRPDAGGTPIIVLELAAQAGFRVETYRYGAGRAAFTRERHVALTGNLLAAGPTDPAL
ncbi:MAG: hypothetical protein ACRELV_02075 [Longimicrobiales bacterium]